MKCDATEQSDPPKSRIGRFLMVSFLAATSVIAGVRPFDLVGFIMAKSIVFAAFAVCIAVGITVAQPKNEPQRVSVSDIGKSVDLIGKLGTPLGRIMNVRGIWSLPKTIVKDFSPRFTVSHVDGRQLNEPVVFNISQLKLLTTDHRDATPTRDEWEKLESAEWHLIAYENGYIAITPDEYLNEKRYFPQVGMPYYTEAFTSRLVAIIDAK